MHEMHDMDSRRSERGRETDEVRKGSLGDPVEGGLLFMIFLLCAIDYYLWVNAGPYWSAM